MKRRRIDWLWIVVAVAAAAGLAYALWPQPLPVDLAEVTQGPMMLTVNEDGRTRVKERYVVAAPLAGQMPRIALDEGDPVEAGRTRLASIEPIDPALLDARTRSEAEARVRAAEAARDQAAANLERSREAHSLARRLLDRVVSLRERRAVAEEELDRAEHEERMLAHALSSAEFGLKVAEYELEVARAALVRVQPGTASADDEHQVLDLRSPINGKVLRVLQKSTTVVTPGMPLLELGDPRDLEVEIDVLSSDAARIEPGSRVLFERWGGDAPLEGRVRLVEPSGFTKVSALGVEEQRVNVIADFVGPPEQRAALGDAYRVEARIVIWETPSAVQVPAGALFRHGQQWAVYVAEEGRARLQPVSIGRHNGLAAEVLDGLAPGTHVILFPGDRIAEAARVTPRR